MCNLHIGDEVICVYPLDDLLDQLGKRWTLLVVGSLGNGARRFKEIQSDLGNLSSRTLTERLKALEALGLVDRLAYDEVPLRVEYSLTTKGRGLLGALLPLLRWASAAEA